jgi:hypothetical protein
MVRIPSFEQSKLASERVGEPTVDKSKVIIAETVEKEAGDITALLEEQSQKQREAQVETDTAEIMTDLSLGFEKDYKDHIALYENDPADKTTLLQETLNKRKQKTLDLIEDQETRNNINKLSQPMIARKLLTEFDWSNGQQAVVALNKITKSSDLLAIDANTAGEEQDFNRYEELLTQGTFLVESSSSTLSLEEKEKLKKLVPQSISKGFINGLMLQNPSELIDLINQKVFKDVFTPDELKVIKKDATSAFKKQKEVADTNRLITFNDNSTDLYNRITAGDRPFSEIEALEDEKQIDERTASLLKDLIIKDIPANEKAEVEMQLWTMQSDIAREAKKKKTKKNFQELLEFQNQVLEAQTQGFITPSTAKTMLGPVRKTLENSIKKEVGEIGIGVNVFEVATETVKDLAKKEGRKNDFGYMAKILDSFNNLAGKVDFAKKLPEEQVPGVKKMLREAVNMVKEQENSVLRLLDGTPNTLLKKNGTAVELFPSKETAITPKQVMDKSRFLLQRSKKTGEIFVFDKVSGKRRKATQEEIKAGGL